ncbi:recombinase family protein [Gordonia sp. ABSL1-1]|uniref:recombinase family protein n=1 Tax=Gordonia sp. ABSL1-1 TaxID=3053923 RepID=UPI002572A57C|nr:recombinase family protein [Gordonia sp. ABSL1-1]MDL9938876.1 recombinase family protein [Gordonia sp. ABSL1-1]
MTEQQITDTPGHVAAYLRVSTGSQSHDAQLDAIHRAGVTPARVFTETASGAAGSDRPEWRECLAWLRDGDVLVVAALDRLGRSVREVAEAIETLTGRGVTIRALREGVDTSTSTGRMVATIMESVAELELELGRERRAASRAARVARGLHATRPRRLSAADEARLVRLRDQGEPVDELVALFGVSRSTVMRTLRRSRELASA